MSVRVIGMVFEGGPHDASQHGVMLALADNADDQGCAFPGVDVLAWKSRQSERNVLRILQELEANGWLSIRRRAYGPRKRGSVYQLNLPKLRKEEVRMSAPEGYLEAKALRSEKPDTVSPRAMPSAASKDVAAPPDDTLSHGPRGDKREGHEVTKTPSRGDNSVIPFNAFNRQEPSGTVKSHPLPLPGEGGEATQDLEEGSPQRRATQEPWDCPEIREQADRVMAECSLSDPRLQPVIGRALEQKRRVGSEPAAEAKIMISNYREYVRLGEELRYTWSPKNFFGQGHWANWRAWPMHHHRSHQRRRF